MVLTQGDLSETFVIVPTGRGATDVGCMRAKVPLSRLVPRRPVACVLAQEQVPRLSWRPHPSFLAPLLCSPAECTKPRPAPVPSSPQKSKAQVPLQLL